MKALETGDSRALSAALDDRLHQPYRRKMINGYDKVRETALSLGCDGFIISGSGSTCLCIGGGEDFPQRIGKALAQFENNWQVYPLTVDSLGAAVIEE